MSDAPLLVARDEGIVTLTVNRPKAMNALNRAVLEALGAEVATLAGDRAVRAVILTGAGEKSFVAGADIGVMSEMGPREALAFAELGHATLDALSALRVPVIAAVNGFCLGGGCELSLACDLVYAADNAKFGQPEVKLGLIPGFGGTQRLARRVGAMRAADLVLSGRMIGAEEAKAIGLCLEVFPRGELMAQVTERARAIAAMGPVAVRTAKAVQARGVEAPLATAHAFEREAFAGLFATHDAKEGMGAFLARRDAAFEDR